MLQNEAESLFFILSFPFFCFLCLSSQPASFKHKRFLIVCPPVCFFCLKVCWDRWVTEQMKTRFGMWGHFSHQVLVFERMKRKLNQILHQCECFPLTLPLLGHLKKINSSLIKLTNCCWIRVGTVEELPAHRSVWRTLHVLGWTDGAAPCV